MTKIYKNENENKIIDIFTELKFFRSHIMYNNVIKYKIASNMVGNILNAFQ
jgi:hypothetical protein